MPNFTEIFGRAKSPGSLFKRLTRAVGSAGLRAVTKLKFKIVGKLSGETTPKSSKTPQPRAPQQAAGPQPQQNGDGLPVFITLVETGGDVSKTAARHGLSRWVVERYVENNRERLSLAQTDQAFVVPRGSTLSKELEKGNPAATLFLLEATIRPI